MLKSVIDIIKHLFRPYKYDKALIDAYTKHCERIEQSIEPATMIMRRKRAELRKQQALRWPQEGEYMSGVRRFYEAVFCRPTSSREVHRYVMTVYIHQCISDDRALRFLFDYIGQLSMLRLPMLIESLQWQTPSGCIAELHWTCEERLQWIERLMIREGDDKETITVFRMTPWSVPALAALPPAILHP